MLAPGAGDGTWAGAGGGGVSRLTQLAQLNHWPPPAFVEEWVVEELAAEEPGGASSGRWRTTVELQGASAAVVDACKAKAREGASSVVLGALLSQDPQVVVVGVGVVVVGGGG